MNYSKQTDQKWQEKWKRERLYKYVPESKKKKILYNGDVSISIRSKFAFRTLV